MILQTLKQSSRKVHSAHGCQSTPGPGYKQLLKWLLPYPVYKLLAEVKWNAVSLFGYRDIRTTSVDYDEYWQNKKGHAKKTAFIINRIHKNSSALDIGCGDGVTLEALQNDTKLTRATGVDVSKAAIDICRKKGLEVIMRDVTDKKFTEQLEVFDYIILADTIEHLPNPEDILLALKGKFRNELIITVLNTGFILYRMRLLFGKFPMQWRIFPGEHLRFWTVKDFKWWIDKLDYAVDAFVPMFGTPGLKKIWPNMFCRQMLFALKEKI